MRAWLSTNHMFTPYAHPASKASGICLADMQDELTTGLSSGRESDKADGNQKKKKKIMY